MKTWWLPLAERIDALSLRERVFLLLSVLVLLVALADVLWLGPTQTSYKQLLQRQSAQSAEVNRLRAELAVSAKPTDASAALRDEIAQSQARLTQMREEVAKLAPAASHSSDANAHPNGAALERALVELLRRSPGLRLLSSGTVPSGAGAAVAVAGVLRHDLEVTVAGPYNDLQRYVKNLEQALPRLRWGEMQLSVQDQVPVLTLHVYVLEVQP